MKLPTRTPQKKSEADSIAIVKYKLGDLGIIRSQTENDYGIDLDLEIVRDGQVTGRLIKIQLKSAKNLRLRRNRTPSVGGIKQSTLAYWCELSFRINVVAYVIDLKTEKIYVAKDLFWQACSRIDGGDSSKSIEFMPEGPNNITFAKIATLAQAYQPVMVEVVAAHKMALRRLKHFLMLLSDAFHYDHGTPVEVNDFRDLLEVCKVLLFWNDHEKIWGDPNDLKNWARHEYWEQKSFEDGWDGLVCYTAQPILMTLLPALIRGLRKLKKAVLSGAFYWSNRDPEYLALVYEANLPDVDHKEELINWAHEFDRRAYVTPGSGSLFVASVQTQAPIRRTAAKEP